MVPMVNVTSQVYFTRNGKIIGKKDVVLPRGGFYPTVGMMSSQVRGQFVKVIKNTIKYLQEKVKVELKPLSG